MDRHYLEVHFIQAVIGIVLILSLALIFLFRFVGFENPILEFFLLAIFFILGVALALYYSPLFGKLFPRKTKTKDLFKFSKMDVIIGVVALMFFLIIVIILWSQQI